MRQSYMIKKQRQRKMQDETIKVNKICGYGWQCKDKLSCSTMHPGEKGFDYLLQQERLRIFKVCPVGEGCNQKGWCVYLHPGEKVNQLCCNANCPKIECFYLHSDSFDISPEQISKNQELKQDLMKLTQEEKIKKSQEMKERGNNLFQNKRYQEAIEQYSLAIVYYKGIKRSILQDMKPQDSVFYSNRAQCWKKLSKWDHVMLDAEQAVEYDSNNLKARLLLVMSICELAKNIQVQEIIQTLNTQIEMVMQIEKMGRDLNKAQFVDLKTLTLKIEGLRNLKRQEIEMLDRYFFINTMRNVIGRSKIPTAQSNELANTMANLEQKVQPIQDCPDYLQCNISFELFKEPLLTPQGISFEKECLDSHFQKNGRNDPITRVPIKQKILFNRAIFDGVEHYKKTIQSQDENVFTLPVIHQLMQDIHFE